MTARFYALLVLAVLGMAPCCLNKAAAQDRETLLTARVCLSESGRHDECRQIAWATAARSVAHHRSYLAELRAYSPRATGVEPYVGREWIARMHPDRSVSDALPLNREALRWRFAALVHTAWRAVRGMDPPPCGLVATDWAATWCTGCRRRMREAGYRRVECGLSNAWYGQGE